MLSFLGNKQSILWIFMFKIKGDADFLLQLSTPNTPSMNPGRKRAAFQRPSSVCSTDSNFSSVSTHQMNPIYHNHQQQHKNKKNSHYSESGLGAKRGSSRAPGKRHHHHFKQGLTSSSKFIQTEPIFYGKFNKKSFWFQGPSNNCEIYSTFKPPQISTVQVNGMNSSQLENDDKNGMYIVLDHFYRKVFLAISQEKAKSTITSELMLFTLSTRVEKFVGKIV